MRLTVRQHFTKIDAAAVVRAYADPGMYVHLRGISLGGEPEVLDHETDGDETSIAVRYRIEADLPSAARMFVDPEKLTFIEYSTLMPDGSGTFDIVPDHYGELLSAFGSITVVGSPAKRVLIGELKIDLGWTGMLFEGPAERGIAEGLQRVLDAQVEPVQKFVLFPPTSR